MKLRLILSALILTGVIALTFFAGKGCSTSEPVNQIPLSNGQVAIVIKGQTLHYKETTTDKTHIDQKNNGTSQGPIAHGGDMKGTLQSPTLDLADETASGGSFKFDIKQLKSGASVIIIAGILFIAAGVVLFIFFKNWTTLLICGAAGALLIIAGVVAETNPVFYVFALAGILGVAGYAVYRGFVHKNTTTALQTVVTGVEATPVETQTTVKAAITTAAADDYNKVKNTISKIKTDLGLQELFRGIRYGNRI